MMGGDVRAPGPYEEQITVARNITIPTAGPAGTLEARYPPIADHGLIGDLQTAALVTTGGVIDFFCCPRFDSPSIFASLLDAERGGYCSVTPMDEQCVSRQLYLPDTAILVTRLMAPSGVGEVIDFMPIEDPKTARAHHQIVRLVRVVRGEMGFEIHCAPRFDYGRRSHQLEMTDGPAVFRSDGMELTVRSVSPLERRGDDVHTTVRLRPGQIAGLMLESAVAGRKGELTFEQLLRMFEDTRHFWTSWLHRSTYRGRWREALARSAITLKLLTYAPTGALVAAPTYGLPELVGGERNWDYRYTWVRDASFSVSALLGLGFDEEAAEFLRWLVARVQEHDGTGEAPLKIMYRVDGSSDLVEETLDHFEGYRGSRPVRVGNGAADQLQLDIYGEAAGAIYLARQRGMIAASRGWQRFRDIVDWVCEHWDQPDEGIWETRGGRQDFLYGRLMNWVALDRAVRMAEDLGWPLDIPRVRAERDRIYEQIMQRGWSDRRQAFVQHYATEVLDASLLMMPREGFISGRDPQWLSTLDAMGKELVSDSLVYRYDPSASPDGLQGHEGTFSMCTFWYIDALARAGRLDEARLVFEKMLTYANHLGLYGEEIGPTGEQLGNFPQAFTHLGLINTAIELDHMLEHGATSGRLDPTTLGTIAPAR